MKKMFIVAISFTVVLACTKKNMDRAPFSGTCSEIAPNPDASLIVFSRDSALQILASSRGVVWDVDTLLFRLRGDSLFNSSGPYYRIASLPHHVIELQHIGGEYIYIPPRRYQRQ